MRVGPPRLSFLCKAIHADAIQRAACPYRKLDPHVLMVESTEHRPSFDTPLALNGPSPTGCPSAFDPKRISGPATVTWCGCGMPV
jgi:hypothetical protein